MSAYYNEFDPYAAQWLRNLIAAGLIAPGEVDERSIEDVRPDDLRGFTQCHFFAGIGGWSYALRLAGWPDDQPVWTGSCPCQPFSVAGKGDGFADQRHLWPAWFHLIRECKPAIVFGEQVASKNAEPWIDLVHADLEGVDYAFGCVPFPAASIGAPHIRDRTYWVANTSSTRLQERECITGIPSWTPGSVSREAAERGSVRATHGLGDANGDNARRDGGYGVGTETESNRKGPFDGGVGDCLSLASATDRVGPANGFWRAADWLFCRDGRWRPVEPGTFPLAHGIPDRVGRLRAYGNAIIPQAAAEFIRAYLEAVSPALAPEVAAA